MLGGLLLVLWYLVSPGSVAPHCPQSSRHCHFEMGTALTDLKARDSGLCCEACAEHVEATHWTFIGEHESCYLFKNTSGITEHPNPQNVSCGQCRLSKSFPVLRTQNLFRHVLAVVSVNSGSFAVNAQVICLFWEPLFQHLFFYGPGLQPDPSHHWLSGLSETLWQRGYGSYAALADAYEKTKGNSYEGYLKFDDDLYLNVPLLELMYQQHGDKLWISDPEPLNSHYLSFSRGSLTTAFYHPNFTCARRYPHNRTFWTIGTGDFFYVPAAKMPEWAAAVELLASLGVAHEIAVTTLACRCFAETDVAFYEFFRPWGIPSTDTKALDSVFNRHEHLVFHPIKWAGSKEIRSLVHEWASSWRKEYLYFRYNTSQELGWIPVPYKHKRCPPYDATSTYELPLEK
eukprot:g72862.t1